MLPFKDLNVVELASVLAGPAVGMFFSELGASVLKVENKLTGGDVTRNWKNPHENDPESTSAYYLSVNWGKRSVMLDLRNEDDRNMLVPYLKEADVVLANFKRGSAERLNLHYDAVRSINPDVIYANITAYGEDSDQPGFDALLQAETGFMHMTGHPGGQHAKMPVALIDILAGHQVKEAVLIALLERARTGRGSHLSISLAASAVAALANQASNFLNTGMVPGKMGSGHPNICPYGDIFRTRDNGDIILAVGTEQHFYALCEALGIPECIHEPKFSTNAERVKNRTELLSLLQRAVAAFDREDLLRRLSVLKVPAGVVRNMREVFEQPFAREMILEDEQGRSVVSTVAFRDITEISPI